MARQSKAEEVFRARYPHANIRERYGLPGVALYAGDYLCSEALTVEEAFKLAIVYERENLITPDPFEKQGDYPEPKQ